MVPRFYKTLEEVLPMIKQAIEGEREDELFYDYLISVAPTQEAKDIITTIRDDERKHNKMFREIYKFFTGEDVMVPTEIDFERPKSYVDGIKKAKFRELAAVERYRDIRAGVPNRYFKDMVFEILTDELKHAHKYDYLLTEYLTSNKTRDIGVRLAKGLFRSENINRTPDEWVMYIDSLVKEALKEVEQGINLEHLFQEYILSGVLVGRGYTPKDAITQVEVWERTGESKLLKESKMKK
ncbi:hypothetical protein Z968_03155 [Clostridium novyi A str. 4552]|uniref:Rubrerythrin diiron-binding domain-containing protein n=2 Tax=Clostridium novyi TaxID=1542 RepID=A0A0A0IAJ1_CLONO|nr:hypothetical protein Z968_03155 [Clostridium novyi A str. 4552]